ncbi:pyridoxal phosphate-dependent decarboxylase family protein [Stygiobacter electus]|uniref:Aminotransferase class V-fold PLP-dependent enzyme n=1 Tax=Stygiobacter electus TaxID=3032292 RepID=A0AAE3P2P9_9BACT|nr:aminotransferase class I/II-fold pyridoxal phosphate-dependent enzyme [Stygiobacter electus]MDF1611993.1 aminotransferase class V-fold PLP-dependent enzyme [Stygiobacter electus]
MKNKNLDMSKDEFISVGKKLINWSAHYLENIESFPVLPNVKPGEIKNKLPQSPPESAEDFESIISDLDKIILPGITHWQHPNFMAYFASTASGPGILADLISSTFNSNGMIWKTSPSLTELEQTVLIWYRKILGFPENFKGLVYDTASVSSLHAIAAARENLNLGIREKGMSSIPKLRLYCSEHAHSSIDKACLTLGLGLDGIKKIPVNENFEMITEELEKAIQEDKSNGIIPMCVVATIGTTSTTSVDPVDKISEICQRENIWLHVDAAYAGVTSMLPEMKKYFSGIENADSIVSNPHKWLFVPIDFSVLFIRKHEVLKKAFSLVPEYLKTNEDSEVENYMDYGIQLGRRFRALKLWFVIRYFGVEGLRERIREHIKIAHQFAEWIDKSESFERLAPTPFSTVCFRYKPKHIKDENILNQINEELINEINNTGKLFLSHTKLNGKFTIRLVVSGIRQEERHVKEAFKLIDGISKQINY